MTDGEAPILVTGLPRSGTSWVGKMLEASGDLVYINEPLNPQHPPGLSPGLLGGPRPVPFQYISHHNAELWDEAFERMLRLRFDPVRELKANHSIYDFGRTAKYFLAFGIGRLKDRRPLVDDPYALMAVRWLVERFGMQAVVLIREPLSYVGSRLNLGWRASLDRLSSQDRLINELMSDHADIISTAAGSDDEAFKTAVLWSAVYAMVDRHLRPLPGVHVVRYEDLASDPVTQFDELYEILQLAMGPEVPIKIREATSPTRKADGGFRWSLRYGLSKTAFRPMTPDLTAYRQRLTDSQIDVVTNVASDVRELYYS